MHVNVSFVPCRFKEEKKRDVQTPSARFSLSLFTRMAVVYTFLASVNSLVKTEQPEMMRVKQQERERKSYREEKKQVGGRNSRHIAVDDRNDTQGRSVRLSSARKRVKMNGQ